MADEGTTAVAITEGAPAAEVEQAQPETETQETPQDVTALLKAVQEEKAQLEQRLRTAQGQLKGKLDTEATLTGLRRDIAALHRIVGALAKGQIAGDTEETQKALAEAQQANQKEELQTGFRTQVQELLDDTLFELEDMGIEARLPNGQPNVRALRAVPELRDMLDTWDNAWDNQNLAEMRRAFRMAREMRVAAQTAEWEKEQVEKRKNNGSLSTPVPHASGKATPTLEALAAKDTRRMTPQELREHEKALDAAIRAGR